jgi:hypothetical protein
MIDPDAQKTDVGVSVMVFCPSSHGFREFWAAYGHYRCLPEQQL